MTPVAQTRQGPRWPWPTEWPDPADQQDDAMAARLGIDRRTLTRWRRHGIPDRSADQAAIRLGTHPELLWAGWTAAGPSQRKRGMRPHISARIDAQTLDSVDAEAAATGRSRSATLAHIIETSHRTHKPTRKGTALMPASKRIHIVMPDDLRQRLQASAEARGLTLSGLVRSILIAWVSQSPVGADQS